MEEPFTLWDFILFSSIGLISWFLDQYAKKKENLATDKFQYFVSRETRGRFKWFRVKK